MSRYESLEDQVEDLATYAVNFSDEHYNTTEKTVCHSWVSCGHGDPGIGWNYLRALQYVKKRLIDPAAKDYKREFGSMTQAWNQMWPLNVRQKAAEQVLGMWLDEYAHGNWSI